jgi:DNA-binding response OmpR family regulator
MRKGAEALRVLIVEDEALIGLMLAEVLKEEGHRIIGPVETRREAHEVLDHARADAAILDFSLQDGFCSGLARELRARGTPFIVFSGVQREQIGTDMFDDVPWIEKPGTVEEIVTALRLVTSH